MSKAEKLRSATALALCALLSSAGCGSDDGGSFEAKVVSTDTNGSQSDGKGRASADAEDDVAIDNEMPVAVDDTASTFVGQPVVIYVMYNDSDPDKDKIKVTEVTQGQLGSVAVNDGGWDITYTPMDAKSIGKDEFSYTIEDARGGQASAKVTVTIKPPPKLLITAPKQGAKLGTKAITVKFEVNGCNFTGPSTDSDGCHAHKFLNGKSWKNKQGKGFGQYQLAPFSIGALKPGKHKFKLVLIKNDGTDQPFEPEISDTVAFEVTQTVAN